MLEGGADFIVAETQMDIQEARAILLAIKEYNPDIIFYPYLDENILSLAKEYPKIVFAFPNYGFNTMETKDVNNIGFFPAIIQSGPVFLG